MKVKDLIKLLQEEDQELEVLVSSDSEGNSFSKIDEGCFAYGSYVNDDSYYVEVGIHPDDLEDGQSEDDIVGPPCLIIYP